MPDPLTPAPLSVHVALLGRSYDVLVGDALLPSLGPTAQRLLPGRTHCALITDTRVAALYADTALASLHHAGIRATLITVPAGEASKALSTAETVLSQMTLGRLDRKSFVVALGGGVIGDLAGFCAALYQRGIPYLQIPTTVLAQVDSSVGGKTGVNLPEAKNMVGAFHQPTAVLADTATLRTLPPREFNEGFAEIIKHACIRDASMLDAIDAVALGTGDLPTLIHRNVAIKARIVEEDEFETRDLRALLNFGHTLGHAIEAAAGYGTMLHGEAISLGLRAAAFLSTHLSTLPIAHAQRIDRTLAAFALPLVLSPSFPTPQLLDITAKDKKFDQGRIRFILLRSLGDAFVSHDVTPDHLRAAIDHLRTPPTPS